MKTKQISVFIVSLVVLSLAVGLPATAGAKSKPIEIVFSTYLPPSYERDWIPNVNFAKTVEKQSDGRVKFKMYHSGQLFKGKEEFFALERGDIDMSNPLDIYYTGVVPEFGITSLPFLWNDLASAQRSANAGLYDLGVNQKLLEKHNIVVLGLGAGDPYQIYAKDFPVHLPKDMARKKWAVSGTTTSKLVELMGGAPTMMSSGELYLALQRGTIDGTIRPLITGVGRKLHEVVGHITITNQAFYYHFLGINKKKWDMLPKDVQQMMIEAGKVRDKEQTEMTVEFMKTAVKGFQDKGVKVHVASKEELAAFRKISAPVYDWWLKQVPEGKKYIEFVEAHH